MKILRIHYLQHVPFEGLGSIETWAKKQGHSISVTKLFENPVFPDLDAFDVLFVMGGSMSVYEEHLFSWLATEKQFIKNTINAKKKVVGICLGGQLLAEVLGAKVYPNKEKEIGWFPIQLLENQLVGVSLPKEMTVFHWHGDTFDIPENARILAKSEACSNQAFLWKNQFLALQFHWEATPETVAEMIKYGQDELIPATFVQNVGKIASENDFFEENNQLLEKIVHNFFLRNIQD